MPPPIRIMVADVAVAALAVACGLHGGLESFARDHDLMAAVSGALTGTGLALFYRVLQQAHHIDRQNDDR